MNYFSNHGLLKYEVLFFLLIILINNFNFYLKNTPTHQYLVGVMRVAVRLMSFVNAQEQMVDMVEFLAYPIVR